MSQIRAKGNLGNYLEIKLFYMALRFTSSWYYNFAGLASTGKFTFRFYYW